MLLDGSWCAVARIKQMLFSKWCDFLSKKSQLWGDYVLESWQVGSACFPCPEYLDAQRKSRRSRHYRHYTMEGYWCQLSQFHTWLTCKAFGGFIPVLYLIAFLLECRIPSPGSSFSSCGRFLPQMLLQYVLM